MHRLLQGDYSPSGENVIVKVEIVPRQHEDFHACFEKTLESLHIGDRGQGRRLAPVPFELNQQDHQLKISFSKELFEPGNLMQHLSIIAGSIFDQSTPLSVRILDVKWPESLQAHFPGPTHGANMIRQRTGIFDRALSSVLLLPRSGISIKDCIEKSYHIWMGGCDLVEDSEMLASTAGNDFYERVDFLSREMINASKRSKSQKIYIPNITAGSLGEIVRRAKKAKDSGLEFVMVNGPQLGLLALDSLRQACKELDLFLAVHQTGSLHPHEHSPRLSRSVMAQIYRHLGVDLLHIRSGVDDDTKIEVTTLSDPFHAHHLHQAAVMPICSAIRSVSKVESIIKALGHDLVLQTEISAYDHPDGLKSGAEAFHVAVVAASQGMKKDRAAHRSLALKKALEISELSQQL
jgi:ribulose-bisphosphate carboxylase large chain